MASKRKYYAVVAGYEPGIYETWTECERQVNGFKGQKHKSFPTRAEAEEFLKEEGLKCGLAESRRVHQNPIKMPPISSKAKGTQVIRESNPFKSHAFRVSSPVLEMAAADYEELRAVPCKTELDLDDVAKDTLTHLPTHFTANLESVSDVNVLYQLEYDGASKGNPGAAGAGALLRHPDGTVVCEVSVGLGKATNNVAEYRGLIAGLRKALDLGIERIQAQGDSKLVTMQVRGKWKINNQVLAVLCKEATLLLKNFKEFQIRHVDREYNSAADTLANKGVFCPEEKFVSSFDVLK